MVWHYVTDLETAFYFGHPREADYRLFELQCRCYLQRGQSHEAQEAFEMASQSVQVFTTHDNFGKVFCILKILFV
jgi:hypothetical protein